MLYKIISDNISMYKLTAQISNVVERTSACANSVGVKTHCEQAIDVLILAHRLSWGSTKWAIDREFARISSNVSSSRDL